MKQLYILIIILFSSTFLKSQMYFQYFDGANTNPLNSLMVTIQTSSTNIWQIGKPQKTLFSSASTTPNVIVTDTINYYPNKNKSVFTFYVKNPFFGGGGQILAVRWKQKLDMDQGLDGGIVEFSSNSGTTWQNAFNNPLYAYQFYGFNPPNKDTLPSGEFCFSGTDNTWRDIWLCFSPNLTLLNDTILMRYTFKSDSINTNKEGWMIDNLVAYYSIMHPVKEISMADYLNVYPSTTNGIVNVEAKKLNERDIITSMELISSDGKVLERYGQNNIKTVIDISHYPSGSYFLKVTTNVKTKTVPITLER